MSMIKVENLTFSYPSSYDNIFENVSFNIDTNWKLGFVGRNGRGKTTFLNLLLGKYEYKGSITANVQFDYFPYYVSDERKLTLDIMKEICPLAEEWELMREISYMDTDTDVLLRPFNRLSKGEQTKVLLGALFLNEGHFLLIDEPTNHLDTKTREIVSEYLKKKKGFILVSHDRCFLDGCVDHILSINRTNTEVQKGNFSSWLMNFERQQRFEEAQNQRLEKDIGRLKRAARRAAHWSEKIENSKYGNGPVDRGYVGHKAAKMMKRSKSIEKNQVREIEQKSELLKNNEKVECLKIFPLEYYRDVMVNFSNVSVCYEGKEIFAPISFEISKGERVAIEGRNGSGKSSLLKLLIDGQAEYKGSFNTGSGIIISYVPQDTSHLKGKLSDFAYENKIDESLFKAILRKMDFERIQFEKSIENFSEGQKKKVMIAKSLCERAHLYVWDEPLNFIDIYSRMQIEELINEFKPAMLFVEHDRAFTDTIATKKVYLHKDI